MNAFIGAVFDRIQRYPVLFFGAVGAWIKSKAHIDTGGGDDLALTATILWLQSAFSLSKKTAEENVAAVQAQVDMPVEVAKYVGAVEHQAVAAAGQAIAEPQRPLRAR